MANVQEGCIETLWQRNAQFTDLSAVSEINGLVLVLDGLYSAFNLQWHYHELVLLFDGATFDLDAETISLDHIEAILQILVNIVNTGPCRSVDWPSLGLEKVNGFHQT